MEHSGRVTLEEEGILHAYDKEDFQYLLPQRPMRPP